MLDNMNEKGKLKEARKLYRETFGADSTWQKDASTAFAFKLGEQWTAEERKILEDELRPCLTFNLVDRMIRLVMGLNEDNKKRYFASPVEGSDGFLCEVVNSLYDWVEDNGDFEIEEDVTFESTCTCGRGYLAAEFEPDPKNLGWIKIYLNNIPVREYRFDPASRKDDLRDAGYRFWDKWVSKEDFKAMYPQHALQVDVLMDSGVWLDSLEAGDEGGVFEMDADIDDESSDYDKPLDTTFYDKSKDLIRIVHMEYRETFTRYHYFNPEAKDWTEFDKKDIGRLKELFPIKYGEKFDYIKTPDQKYKWLIFIGDKVLFDGDSPMPFDGAQTIPCFAYSDISRKTNHHHGIVKPMIDPQKEVNKRWSQVLNLLNNQVQPGIVAEEGTFVNDQQAAEALKTPGEVAWVNSGKMESWKERGVPTFPSAPMQLEEASQSMLYKITGINPDLLGMDRGRQEPGVVVRLRQQQGIVLLKRLFGSYNRMKKEIFRRVVSIILEYMPEEQIIAILGETDRFIVKGGMVVDKKTGKGANLRDVKNVRYNIRADEAPGNMTARMMEISTFLEMASNGFPVDPKIVIGKLDISESEKQQWVEYIDAQSQAAQAKEEAMAEMQKRFKSTELALEEKGLDADFMIKLLKVLMQEKKDKGKVIDMEARRSLDGAKAVMDYGMRLIESDKPETQAQGA